MRPIKLTDAGNHTAVLLNPDHIVAVTAVPKTYETAEHAVVRLRDTLWVEVKEPITEIQTLLNDNHARN